MQVSSSGSSVQTAAGPQILLQDKWPMAKLDTTKVISFQTISILFNREPHQPDPTTFRSDTVVYSFPHGYSYTPRVWMEWQNKAPAYPAAPGSGGHATTFFDFGDDSANENFLGGSTALSLYASAQYNADPTYGTAGCTAFFYVVADDTNVYIHLGKEASASFNPPAPVFIIGTTANLRVYTFVEKANILPNVGGTMQTNLYKFSVYRNAAWSNAGLSLLKCDSVLYDTSSNYDTSTGLFTAPVAGVYHFSAAVVVSLGGGIGYGVAIYNNTSGVAKNFISISAGSTTFQWTASIGGDLECNAGDEVQMSGYTSGQAGSTGTEVFFDGYFVSK